MKKKTKILLICLASILIVILVYLCYVFYMKSTYISKDVVKEIILNDTKLSEKDVTFKEIDLDTDDGLHKYEVEFYYNRTEYKYEIDAKNGKIIYSNFNNSNNTVNNTTTQDNSNSSSNESEKPSYITKDEAKDVALKDAMIDEANASFVKVELDYENGQAVYDIEFISGILEYDYEIDAITKEIISKKQERN